MKENHISLKDFLYIVPTSLALGIEFTSVQNGNWVIGFLSFSFLFLISFVFLKTAHGWSNGGKTLAIIIVLGFFLRILAGVTLHLGLPIYGHEDEDDRAGYVFTDAHKRDTQAWTLATSDLPITDAFNRKYATDQYGGLLAFNALIYRYLSPDAQRPLLLILFSAFFAALGIPFLWKAVNEVFGEKVAWASAWIFALYPESILLGASAMREPYLLTCSAFALWGFLRIFNHAGDDPSAKNIRNGWFTLGLSLLGMLLVSSPTALITIVVLIGWSFFTKEKNQISWKAMVTIAAVFMLGVVFLSLSLNRSGQFESSSPLYVINGWLKSAVKLEAYKMEGDSGWVQKILGDQYGETVYKPSWYRLPFLVGYGVFQPVLPATLIYPTKPIWRILGILRATGWYALLPMLILSFGAANRSGSSKTRNVLLWLSLLAWIWILLAALRGGGDLWDNPRYRTILFLWQAVLAGYVWVWWRETRNPWLPRIVLMEVVFLVIFTHWYGSRYYHWAGQLPFPVMVALILGGWGVILFTGWWQDKRSSPVDKKRA